MKKYVWSALPLVLFLAACEKKEGTVADGMTTNAAIVDADNTAQNARDRNDATLTPGDQGESPADRAITQNIRKALMAGDALTMSAKNVKIITVNGKVTLRGPVSNPLEKTAIVSAAKKIAGDGNVDDQLEVKANP